MGLAGGVDAGVGIKDVIGQVFPSQQQHGRKQKEDQLIEPHREPLLHAPTGCQQHGHHGHGIHRPLERSLPEAPALSDRGMKACDDLRLVSGQRQLEVREGPYI